MSERKDEIEKAIADARDAIDELEDTISDARMQIRKLEDAIEDGESAIEEIDNEGRIVPCMPALREWAKEHGLIPI